MPRKKYIRSQKEQEGYTERRRARNATNQRRYRAISRLKKLNKWNDIDPREATRLTRIIEHNTRRNNSDSQKVIGLCDQNKSNTHNNILYKVLICGNLPKTDTATDSLFERQCRMTKNATNTIQQNLALHESDKEHSNKEQEQVKQASIIEKIFIRENAELLVYYREKVTLDQIDPLEVGQIEAETPEADGLPRMAVLREEIDIKENDIEPILSKEELLEETCISTSCDGSENN